ncbi:MAG: SurA N-terminal domain-containing protein [Bacillota bacterium]
MKNKLTILLITLMSTLLLAACGGNDDKATDNDAKQNEEQPTEQAQAEEVDPKKVVVKVNGEEIKGEEYNTMMQQTSMMMMQFGQGTDPEAIKEQTINSLIEQKLLSQEVANKGYKASEQEVEDYLAEIKASYESEEKFEEALKSSPLTIDTLKKQIADELALEKYLEKEVGKTEVTDEQIQEYYDQAKAQNDAQLKELSEEEKKQQQPFPELADVKEDIKGQLEQQETSKKLQAIVEDLKKKGEIEKLI